MTDMTDKYLSYLHFFFPGLTSSKELFLYLNLVKQTVTFFFHSFFKNPISGSMRAPTLS